MGEVRGRGEDTIQKRNRIDHVTRKRNIYLKIHRCWLMETKAVSRIGADEIAGKGNMAAV